MKTEKINLTQNEVATLEAMKKFPFMDKGSQDRIRAKVNHLRRTSANFAKAFEQGLSSIAGLSKVEPKESLLGGVKDVLTHPITALKAKVGASMLKQRNAAPKIVEYPDPVLSTPTKEWDFEARKKDDLVAIVRKLGAALRGVSYGQRLGMAAPQIGISERVMICQGAVCVNPTWNPPHVDTVEKSFEACYSVPGKLFEIERSKYGWASWFSIDGVKREFKLNGLNAIVYQHELDHLNGKCCCDVGKEVLRPGLEKIK